MLLPNAHHIEYAEIVKKVIGYCLNESHEYGQHKAYLFRSLLGITLENSSVLSDAIFQASQQEGSFFVRSTPYCDIYNIVFTLRTNTVSADIRTGWCVSHTTGIPHLTTA
jgi:hypothetical protein